MTKRDEFTAAELEQVKQEEANRLVRSAVYKSQWYTEKKSKSTDLDKKKRAEYMREWRAKNPERSRRISRKGNAKYLASNPATRRKSAREYNARRRSELMAFFGGKCVICGFDDSRALHLDHIHGGGNQIRKQGGHGLFEKWKMTRDNPEEARATFQLLCANCNNIKRFDDYEYGRKVRLRKAAGL